jgi:hypothetical protein
MAPDLSFKICNLIAVTGWIALLLSPQRPRLAQLYAGLLVPLLLAIAYVGLIMAFWTGTEGGFSTLSDVMKLFTTPEVALAGWVHYLAFDLFVGAWEVRTAREDHVPFVLVVPCLALTFLFGPAGLLAFASLWAARRLTRANNLRPL